MCETFSSRMPMNNIGVRKREGGEGSFRPRGTPDAYKRRGKRMEVWGFRVQFHFEKVSTRS